MSKSNLNDLLKQRLANLVDSYLGGAPYQLDDEARTAICMEINTALIKPSPGYAFQYAGYGIPYYFNKHVFSETLFQKTEVFEIRGEVDVQNSLDEVVYLLSELRTLIVIEAINALNFKYLTDEVLINMYAVIIRYPQDIASYAKEYTAWDKPSKLEELYSRLPAEFKSSFKFSKEIKKRLDDEAKQAKDRSSQTQDNAESIPQ